MSARVRWFAVGCVLWAAGLGAQPIPQPQLGDRLINLPSHLVLGPATMEVTFTHRFSQTTGDAGAGNLYGLDSSADIGLGFGMGFGHGLDVQLYRSTFLKEYELSGKWTALRQGSASPIGLALRVGTDYRAATGITDRWSVFGQAVVAWRPGEAVDLFLVPTYATDTPTLTNAFNCSLATSVHLSRTFDLVGEATPPNGDTPDAAWAWSLGFNIRIPGHAFLIYLGNSRATVTDMMTGSDIPGGFKTSDLRLGFNLIRRFPE